MSEILVQVVDENDKPVRGAHKDEIHREGLLHRVVYIMVEDPTGTKLLLQKRSKHMTTFPNCWDVAVGGHVDEGEDYYEAAKRELKEELGLEKVIIEELGNFKSKDVFEGRKLNRFNMAYKAVIPIHTPLKLQTVELSTTDWINVERLKLLLRQKPEEFAIGLKQCLEHFY